MDDNQTLNIEVYSDVICPWCYIGKRRFEAALAARPQLNVALTWKPFQLNPDMPQDGMDRQEYLETKFGGPENAKRTYAPIVDAGAGAGIEFNFEGIKRTPNTINAHRLIDFAASQSSDQEAIVQALFDAYFIRGEDIGDLDVLAACAATAGLDQESVRTYLESDDDRHKIAAQDVSARQLGIQGVPFFVLNGKYAVSGAQTPDAFVRMFDQLVEEMAAAD